MCSTKLRTFTEMTYLWGRDPPQHCHKAQWKNTKNNLWIDVKLALYIFSGSIKGTYHNFVHASCCRDVKMSDRWKSQIQYRISIWEYKFHFITTNMTWCGTCIGTLAYLGGLCSGISIGPTPVSTRLSTSSVCCPASLHMSWNTIVALRVSIALVRTPDTSTTSTHLWHNDHRESAADMC